METGQALFIDHRCALCGRLCKNRRSLGNHLSKSHPDWDMERYVLQHFLGGVIPTCACGCGNTVGWHKQLYKFNLYITGHNNPWSADNQPKLSQTQVEKRIESIRRSYEERGHEIKERISSSVRQSLARDEWKDAQSRRSTTLWEDPDFRRRVSDSQKRAWRDNYQERYDAVFTNEFRRKVSVANAGRDAKKKSAQEAELFQVLAQALGTEIQADHWVQWDGGAKCFDAWIPAWNLLLEFDGTYWHGLDREEGFTVDQVSNMANDFLKNRVAQAKEHCLARIALSQEVIQGLQTLPAICLDDVISAAYHYQTPATIVKDGMFRFRSDDQALLKRADLIRWNEGALGGLGRDETQRRALPAVIRFFDEYFRDPSRGWFFPTYDAGAADALADVLSAPAHVIEAGTIQGSPRAGNDYLKSRMRSFWHADSGPARTCTDPKILERVLAYRMGLNNSRPYTYEIAPGQQVTTQETFDLSPKTVRNGFVVQRSAVSWFSPVLARDLWRLALEGCGAESPVVWDPSAGFGARMLGFAAAYPSGTYVATEPAALTFADLEGLRDELLQSGTFRGEIFLERTGSEKVKLPAGFLDAVMTSPPYFDLERYFDEPGQCWRDYPDFDSWSDLYLTPTLVTARQALKASGLAVINVSQGLEGAVIASAHLAGFRHERTLMLARRRDHFARKKGTSEALGEPVIFLRAV